MLWSLPIDYSLPDKITCKLSNVLFAPSFQSLFSFLCRERGSMQMFGMLCHSSRSPSLTHRYFTDRLGIGTNITSFLGDGILPIPLAHLFPETVLMVISRLHASRPGGTGHVRREGCSIAYLSTCCLCRNDPLVFRPRRCNYQHRMRACSQAELIICVPGSTPGGEMVVYRGSSFVRGCWIKQIRVIFCALHQVSYSWDAGQDAFRIVFDTLPVR